jgi:hypothetical protein
MTACNETLDLGGSHALWNQMNETPDLDGSQALWNQIVGDYRQICILRRQGQNAEASRLVREKLPQSIALWARQDGRNAAQKKAVLEHLFATEHRFLDSLFASQRELAARLAELLIPAVSQHVGREVRKVITGHFEALCCQLARAKEAFSQPSEPPGPARERIRFADIPAVIDAVLAEQQADHGGQGAFTR